MLAIGRTVLFSFIFLLLQIKTNAQILNNPEVRFLTQSSIWQLIVNNNSEASRYNKILKRYFPNHPLPYLLSAFNQISESMDYQMPLNKNNIEPTIKKALSLTDSLIQLNRNSENYFLSGAAYSIAAYYNLISNNYFTAFLKSLSAIDYFNKCLELNSGYSEALIVIASYQFWLNDKLKSISWIKPNEAKNPRGVGILKKEIKNENNLLQPLGIESLIWIQIHRKKIKEAINIARNSLKLYPNSHLFLDALAHAYLRVNKLKGIRIFKKLLKVYESSGKEVNYQKVLIGSKIALNLYSINKFEQALKFCRFVLAVKLKNNYQKKLAVERKTKMEQLKKRIVKKLLKK